MQNHGTIKKNEIDPYVFIWKDLQNIKFFHLIKCNIFSCVNNKNHVHILTYNSKYKQECFLENFSEKIRNL